MFIALCRFADRQDNRHIYEAGEQYPRPGFEVTAERIAQLVSCDNLSGKPLIKAVEAPEATPEEIPVEPQKPAKKPARSRKKG